jgi:hypothetical protein
MTKVKLSHKKLRDIPYMGDRECVTHLDLEGNRIKIITFNPFPLYLQELNLSYNNISELSPNCFPQTLKILNLSYNKIRVLKTNTFPRDLEELDLKVNYITKINRGCFQKNLKDLKLNSNRITKLSQGYFPRNLKSLDLGFNKISEINRNVLPRNLESLDLTQNNIDKLVPNNFPRNLQRLGLYRNNITKLVDNCFPKTLQYLALHGNKISDICEFKFPPNLRHLGLSENKISRLIPHCFPQTIIYLDISINRIPEIPTNCIPHNIEILDISHNRLEKIPLHMLSLKQLKDFTYYGLPGIFSDMHPLVRRWLIKMTKNKDNIPKIYSDSQNIHDSNIQSSFRTSLGNIMTDLNLIAFDICKNEMLESNLSEKVKRELLNYCDDNTEHSIYLITFKELFHYVMNRIINHKDKNEMLKILEEEIKDTICKCFTGRMTRLLNVLNGFYDDISIQIGSNEQISNIIIRLRDIYEGDELIKQVRLEMEEREYDSETIEEWLTYVE